MKTIWGTRIHSSRMHTACLLTVSCSISYVLGGSAQPPLEADPPDADVSLVMWPVNHAGKPTSPLPPTRWREGMAHACENITLSHTMFAGGKNENLSVVYLPIRIKYLEMSLHSSERSESFSFAPSVLAYFSRFLQLEQIARQNRKYTAALSGEI